MITKQRKIRKNRIKARVRGSADRPRLTVYRSNKHMHAQLIDDQTGKSLVTASDKAIKGKDSKVARAQELGKLLAAQAKKQKITAVVFDRSGYQYHGRVKAVAEGAREGGLVL